MNAVDEFRSIIGANRTDGSRGICSLCTAHAGVLRAAMLQAIDNDSMVLVESTSNQVDQYGGYTGMTPAAFVTFVTKIAEDTGFPARRLLLGGDHLGPNSWQSMDSVRAMANSRELVRQYVAAGYQKIHLDASMHLADDVQDRSRPLPDEIVARRAAELCAAAEEAWKTKPRGTPAPVYIIGTEVPVPGGATAHEELLRVTPAADARTTLDTTRKAFLRLGLDDAWERVCGLVVQPGVEYGDDQVFDFRPDAAMELSRALDGVPNMVFEAHSTDYQRPDALEAMNRMHFAIQKVGPWLTFAWREALFALAEIENRTMPDGTSSGLVEQLEAVMIGEPKHWVKYYHGTDAELRIKRKFSYSDRCRYYWPDPRLEKAVGILFGNLRRCPPSPTLLSQYLPLQYSAWRDEKLSLDPVDLAGFHVREVIRVYSRACGTGGTGN